MNTAFDRLHRYSRNRHQRLSHVARQVVVGDLGPEALDLPTGAAS
jgi:hypothetical protein